MNPIDHAINSAPKYFICEGTMSPMSISIRILTMLCWNFLFSACLKVRGSLIFWHALITQLYSRRHGIKSYGFKCLLCQFIATACDYLLGVMHLLNMLHASFKFTPSLVVEQDLAVGHGWRLAVPGFLIRPADQIQGSTSSMAADYTVSLALISPPPMGQFPLHGETVRKFIMWYSLMRFSSPSYPVPPINPILAPQPHSGPGFLLTESSQWHSTVTFPTGNEI